jgi:uncharacterized protein YbjT (DUF2867 family)
MNLVIGATGQLGTSTVRKLLDQGRPVRAFVRPSSEHQHLVDSGADLVFGDLRDRASLDAACRGVEAVISTATAISPGRGGGGIKDVDDAGYGHLIEACREQGVRQFIFASFPPGPRHDKVLLSRAKRRSEARLRESGIAYTIFQFGMFADIWPALLGSRIPERGAEVRTLERPFWFLRFFRNATGDLIDRKGKASVPGRPDTPVSFITIDDVASIMANAVGHPEAMNRVFEVGGPEVLTWAETVELFSRVLERPIKASYAPGGVFRAMQLLLAPFSSSAGSVMGLNWLAATGAMPPPDPDRSREIAAKFGVTLTPFEEFLRAKARLQPA